MFLYEAEKKNQAHRTKAIRVEVNEVTQLLNHTYTMLLPVAGVTRYYCCVIDFPGEMPHTSTHSRTWSP